MTIKIEREALLTVLRQPPSNSSRGCPYDDDEEECVSTSCEKGDGDYIFLEAPKEPYKSYATQYSFDDDSVTTASTSDLDEKRVSFADSVVTCVWERPRTSREEMSVLFYSCEDTQRYVNHYEQKRERNPATLCVEPTSGLVCGEPLDTAQDPNEYAFLGYDSFTHPHPPLPSLLRIGSVKSIVSNASFCKSWTLIRRLFRSTMINSRLYWAARNLQQLAVIAFHVSLFCTMTNSRHSSTPMKSKLRSGMTFLTVTAFGADPLHGTRTRPRPCRCKEYSCFL